MSTSTETKPPIVIGLIADTHCKLADGSDLPDAATDALRGCDLIVHLGDLTSLGVLDRLAAGGAEVIGIRNPILDVPAGTDRRLVDGPVYRNVLGRRLAFVREYPTDGVSADVIAYGVPPAGGGHDHRVALVGTTLIVTPGSPNLPVRHGTVARLTFTEIVDVEIVHLPT
ncbi:MAG: metallophosphoesterase family protein [Acidimicrobiales bacterium]